MENQNQTEATSQQQNENSESLKTSGSSQDDLTPEQLRQPTESEKSTTKELEQVVSDLQQEIVLLKQRLDDETEKVESFKTQYTRTLADFENFRKRTQKEKEEIEQKVKRNIIAELLPVVDNFERARTQIKPATEGEKKIHNSYQGVYKNLADSLKRLGVSPMRPEGQPFDPVYHEALLREPSKEYAEGVVVEQLERGYLLGDQVIRHARVKVAAAYEESVEEELEAQNQ